MNTTMNLFRQRKGIFGMPTIRGIRLSLFVSKAFIAILMSGDAHSAPSQTQQSSASIPLRKITPQLKILCFTRFLIEIPSTAKVAYGRLTAGGEITRVKGGAEKIDTMIVERINANKENSKLFSREIGLDLVAEKIHPSSKENIKHLVNVVGFSEYSIRSFFKLNNDAFILSELGVPESSVNNFLDENVETAQFLRARKENEIPNEPGICIDGAFSKIESIYEGIELGARIKEYPDVHFSIQIIKNGGYLQKVDLAQNVADAKQESKSNGLSKWVSHLKILRQGKRVVNDWHGEEMLLRIPSGNDNPSHHKFTFRASGEKYDPLHPFVEMTLDTGVKGNQSASVEPSLSDAEALALWDWLLNSIRVRPNAVAAKASAPAKPGG